MAVQAQRKPRVASPARWTAAAKRAVEQGIQVRQLNTSGAWVATSGSDSTVCYLMEIRAGHVESCSCPTGDFGDPVCKHAARFYLDLGLLDEPEPDPPAPQACFWCDGRGRVQNVYRQCYEDCDACGGSGERRVLPGAAPVLPTVAVA